MPRPADPTQPTASPPEAQRAIALAQALRAAGVPDARFDTQPVRPYLAKVVASGLQVAVYYSPKKRAFSRVVERLNGAFKTALEAAWEKTEALPPAATAPPAANPATTATAPAAGPAWDPQLVEAWTDGSYQTAPNGAKTCGFGVVLVVNGKAVGHLSGHTEDALRLHNIIGEVLAVETALEWAFQHGVRRLEIVHDLAHLNAWVDEGWKAKDARTQRYVQTAREARAKGLQLSFRQVPGHRGVAFNEQADRLADAAAARRLEQLQPAPRPRSEGHALPQLPLAPRIPHHHHHDVFDPRGRVEPNSVPSSDAAGDRTSSCACPTRGYRDEITAFALER